MLKIVCYTDGACLGNPGQMGAGAILVSGENLRQVSVSLGQGTNNIAELQAISLALSKIKPDFRKDAHITIKTDSQYCIGVLGKNWRTLANVALVLSIKELMREFGQIKFEKVTGHSGDKYNEWAHNLATQGASGRPAPNELIKRRSAK